MASLAACGVEHPMEPAAQTWPLWRFRDQSGSRNWEQSARNPGCHHQMPCARATSAAGGGRLPHDPPTPAASLRSLFSLPLLLVQ